MGCTMSTASDGHQPVASNRPPDAPSPAVTSSLLSSPTLKQTTLDPDPSCEAQPTSSVQLDEFTVDNDNDCPASPAGIVCSVLLSPTVSNQPPSNGDRFDVIEPISPHQPNNKQRTVDSDARKQSPNVECTNPLGTVAAPDAFVAGAEEMHGVDPADPQSHAPGDALLSKRQQKIFVFVESATGREIQLDDDFSVAGRRRRFSMSDGSNVKSSSGTLSAACSESKLSQIHHTNGRTALQLAMFSEFENECDGKPSLLCCPAPQQHTFQARATSVCSSFEGRSTALTTDTDGGSRSKDKFELPAFEGDATFSECDDMPCACVSTF